MQDQRVSVGVGEERLDADAAVDLADSPLFLTVAVPPNITVTLDDSGSMAKAFVPEICGTGNSQYDCSTLNNRYTKSSHYNPIYYDPNVQYPPPKRADGTELETSFDAAYRNGFDPRASGGLGTRNLNTGYRPTANLDFPPGTTAGRYFVAALGRMHEALAREIVRNVWLLLVAGLPIGAWHQVVRQRRHRCRGYTCLTNGRSCLS